MYTVKVELHPEVKTEVKVWVVPGGKLPDDTKLRTAGMAAGEDFTAKLPAAESRRGTQRAREHAALQRRDRRSRLVF